MDVIDEAADIARAVSGRTLLDVFAENAQRYGSLPALRWRTGAGWATLTWREYRERVLLAARGLLRLGLRPGERVGVLMSNRPELAVADLALLHTRAVPVCLFDSFTDEQLSTVVGSLGIRFVIADGPSTLDRMRRAAGDVRAVTVDAAADAVPWADLMAGGDGDLDACLRAARPDDVVSVNYTSGTTGSLKGVRHTHGNVLWHAESFARFLPLPPGTRFLSYLPRAHATERFVTTWFPLTRAGTVHLCPDPARLPEYLPDVRPQFFGGVQRVWEKLYATGAPATRLGLDACGFAFSGGGALAPRVQEHFNAMGVPLTEGWGQSELVSAATCARPEQVRAGTVGVPLPGVAVRVADDGELLVRSGSRMAGYAGPVADAATEDAGGWLHTGDLGEIGPDGYVRVLGRRQEVLRLGDGYPVPLTRVESQLRANLLVDQACVVGEAAGGLSAILVTGPAGGAEADLVRIVQQANRYLPERERITRVAVLAGPWVPGRADELTHTGKLRRPVVLDKYGALVRSGAGTAVP